MGWFVMAHADVLAALPESHPDYAQLSLQMKSLLTAVMAARGADKLWHQVMDRPESEENYAESSCSAMFIYGLAKGKALGLCGAKEEAAARESMDALWQKKRRHGGGRLPRTDAHLQGRGAGRGAVSRRQL